MDAAREEAELRAYLGDAFDLRKLQAYERTLADELAAIGDEQQLYRRSEAYLYNLTAFAMTQTKAPYLAALRRHVAPGARVLDYGCGIGSDGLVLAEGGYDVAFADFDNPSIAYLRWRMKRRRLAGTIYDLDDVPGGFDAAFAFDVIEHVPDPFAFLAGLEERAELLVVNLLESVPDDQTLHRDLPVRRLLDHVAARQLIFHRVFHGRSHLVVYRPEIVDDRARRRNRLAMTLHGLVRRLTRTS